MAASPAERRVSRMLAERVVGPVLVVVLDVAEDDPFELSAVPHEIAVQELPAQRADPSFGERVGDWGAHRGLEDLDLLALRDSVG